MKTSRSYTYALNSVITLYGNKHAELSFKIITGINYRVKAIIKSRSNKSIQGTQKDELEFRIITQTEVITNQKGI